MYRADMSCDEALPTSPDFADSSQARPALSLRLWPNRIVHKLLTLKSASLRLTGSKRLRKSNQGLQRIRETG